MPGDTRDVGGRLGVSHPHDARPTKSTYRCNESQRRRVCVLTVAMQLKEWAHGKASTLGSVGVESAADRRCGRGTGQGKRSPGGTHGWPGAGASPDFDGDGKADLAAGIYLDQSDQYALRIWYGSGAVTDVTSADAGGPVVTDGEGGLRGPLLARDFNGDGYCDLAFTSPGAHLSVVQVFGSATGSTWRAGTPPRWPPPVTLCTPKRWPW